MLAAGLLAAAAVAAAPCAPGVPHRYVVVERDASGALLPLWQAAVRLAEIPGGESDLPAVPPDADTVVALVRDGAGRPLVARVQRPARWLRGEFARPGGGGAIDGSAHPLERSHFVVRLPDAGTGRVELLAAGRAPVDVDAGADPGAEAAGARGAAAEVVPLRSAGSPANRLDLLIVGEGYTAAQRDGFLAGAAVLAEEFLAAAPWAEYAAFVNAAALFVPSPEEGADHPPFRADCAAGDPTCCADPAARDDPRAGRWAATAFGAGYCTLGIHRLLTVDVPAVLVAAAAAPDWDVLLVLVNDPVYGGSGGQLAVASTDPRAPEIALHELGHSFALLADEYASPYPGFPACSDLAGPAPCEPNVTDVIERDALKWTAWVLPDTPLPTPASDPAYAGALGLFEGARYLDAGMFRPRLSCLMRQLGVSPCEVCREAFVGRLYRGGWGIPATGIDLVEPGSERPPPGPLSGAVGTPIEVAVELLAPAAGLTVTWRVDGGVRAGEHGPALSWAPPHPGVFRLELEVRDASGFVHPAHGADLAARRAWEIRVPAPRPPRSRVDRGSPM